MRSWGVTALLMVTASTVSPQIIQTGSLDSGGNGAAPSLLAVAPALPAGDVTFVSSAPLELEVGPDMTASTYVEVAPKNNVGAVSFYLSLKRKVDQAPCSGMVATMTGATAIQKDAKTWIGIEVTGCPAAQVEGVIGIRGSSATIHERPIVLKRSASTLMGVTLGLSVGLALALVIAAWKLSRLHGHTLGDVIGEASWDFSSSWASNVTAFGALFGFVTQLSVFPTKPAIASRSGYMFLASFALALVALAPAVQRATASASPANDTAPAARATHSIVGGFLLASLFTLWGALLQFGAQLLVLKELSRAVMVDSTVLWAARALVVVAAAGISIYSLRTMLATIAENATKSAAPTGTLRMDMFQRSAPPADEAAARKISVL